MESGRPFRGLQVRRRDRTPVVSRPDEVRLTPKAAAVLKELVTHAGTPVSKESLFAAVWSGTAVGDDALTSCVQELRRALNDDPKQPRFIETRHRRGYRFMASLTPASPQHGCAPLSRTPAISSIARPAVCRHEPGARSGVPLRGHRGGADDGAVAGGGLARGRANGVVSFPPDRRRRARDRATPAASRRCSTAACGRPTTVCGSPCSWWTSRPDSSTGPSDSTGRRPTCSRCRTKSPNTSRAASAAVWSTGRSGSGWCGRRRARSPTSSTCAAGNIWFR